MRQVQLNNLVPVHRSSVGDIDRNRDLLACRSRGFRHLWIAIREARVTQPVPEGIKSFTGEIAVGPVGHRIILKRRKLIDGLIERYWQSASRAETAGERFGHGSAALFAWVPCFENRRHVLVSPIDGDGAAVH